jgi:hypothetical protein
MNVDDLTIKQARIIAAMFPANNTATPNMRKCELGWRIVVIDRGWVLVGHVMDHGDHLFIRHARCVRKWGTSKGLGELANGPLRTTEHDPFGDTEVPSRAVIFTMTTEGDKWSVK